MVSYPFWAKRTGWVKSIDIDTQIYWVLRSNPVPDLLDDTFSADGVNLPSLRNLEATVAVIFIVRWTRQRRADAGVDVRVVGEKTFLRGVEEISTVVDTGLIAGSTTKDLRLPGVADCMSLNPRTRMILVGQEGLQMTVEMDDAYWSVLTGTFVLVLI